MWFWLCWGGFLHLTELPRIAFDEPSAPAIVEMKRCGLAACEPLAMTVSVKNDNRIPLVVPPALRRKAGFKSGEQLEIKASGRVITIVPKLPAADDDYTPEQRRMVDARLAKADEDIKTGRVYGPFNTAQEMAASIEANIKKLRTAKRNSKSGDEAPIHGYRPSGPPRSSRPHPQGLLQAGRVPAPGSAPPLAPRQEVQRS